MEEAFLVAGLSDYSTIVPFLPGRMIRGVSPALFFLFVAVLAL